jgi:hypothetical protein
VVIAVAAIIKHKISMDFCVGQYFNQTHPLAPMVLSPSLFKREGGRPLAVFGVSLVNLFPLFIIIHKS